MTVSSHDSEFSKPKLLKRSICIPGGGPGLAEGRGLGADAGGAHQELQGEHDAQSTGDHGGAGHASELLLGGGRQHDAK